MSRPLDLVKAAHNALRHDIALIDGAAVGAAHGRPGLAATVERFHFLNEVLAWYAHGEEAGIFLALERVAPSVVDAYETDGRLHPRGGGAPQEGSPREASEFV
jgi:hypothetical protein